MATTLSRSPLDELQSQLLCLGFDLVHAFEIPKLNSSLVEALAPLLDGGQSGLLVGNTRILWDPFLTWLARHPSWETCENPLEQYTEEVVTKAVHAHLPQARTFWTHETHAYLVPAQKLCHETGLAYLSKGRFNIHPTYGPWFALRALVVIPDDLRPSTSAPLPPMSADVEARVASQIELLSAQASTGLDSHHIRTTWSDWLALRDLYQTGRAHRYSDDQIRYHYTQDKAVLRHALAQHRGD